MPTERLLCTGCEKVLSREEKQFAENLFHPFQACEGGAVRFEYEEWLLRFAVSLTWRTAVTERVDHEKMGAELTGALDKAKRQWRSYLIGEADDPGPYEHHMFFLDVIDKSGDSLPDGINAYFLRAVDCTIAYSSHGGGVYVKLPGIILWASLVPTAVKSWSGIRIAKNGTICSPQTVADPAFGEFVVDRARQSLSMMAGMSERQREAVDAAIRRDPDRVIESGTFDAIMADRRLRDAMQSED